MVFMKLKWIVLLCFVCSITGVKAQHADEYVRGLLERADWFGLEESYPVQSAGIQSGMLKLLAEAMLHAHFNQPDIAISCIDTLLTYHQNELGLDNVYDLIALKSRLYAEQGLYEEASANCSHFLNQLAAFHLSRDRFPVHLFLEKYYDEIAYIPKPVLIRPDRDVEIPLVFEKNDRGQRMYLPVTVHGKEYRFLLDAGAGMTYISDRMAKEMNVHVAHESVEIKNAEKVIGKTGAIDSMQIGDMVLKEILILIGMPDPEADESFQADAVLGFDFFRLMGETQLFPGKGKVVFPAKQTRRPKSGRNLMIDNNVPYLKVFAGGERLVFRPDAGRERSGLFYPYYLKHKEWIESKAVKESIRENPMDGMQMSEVYRLPQLPLKIGKKKFTLKRIPVFTDQTAGIQPNEDGVFGMDFITRFKKVVINVDEMFVEVK